MKGFQIVGPGTVRDAGGRDHDVLEAIDNLPWVDQTCPGMPHQYAHLRRSDRVDYGVVDTMLTAKNHETYRAYFRGLPTPLRYWEAPDGQRYWLTMYMINRCLPDSVEPPRRVDEGAKPIPWDTFLLAPKGSHTYERYKNGWIPTEEAIAAGYRPCASCQTKVDVRRRHLAHRGPSSQNQDRRTELDRGRIDMASRDVPKARVVRKLLELRAQEAPLGSTGYRGQLSQKAIAEVADVTVQEVTKAAIAMDQERMVGEGKEVE